MLINTRDYVDKHYVIQLRKRSVENTGDSVENNVVEIHM